jgi:nitrate/TMAO reductase-like tetraheme cytochrome c subunit
LAKETEREQASGLLGFLRTPCTRYAAGVLIFVGLLIGSVLIAGGAYLMGKTNSLEFCISCHTMRDTVYQEYKESLHYQNASGVRATCPDCHVPKAFGPLIVAKVLAVADVYHEIVGSIETPERFEAKRWEMANKVWRQLEETDSGTCRSCHGNGHESMALDQQDRLAGRKHKRAFDEGDKTCIDCHKGLTHKMPDEPDGKQAHSTTPARAGAG